MAEPARRSLSDFARVRDGCSAPRHLVVSVVVVLAACALFPASYALTRSPWSQVATFAAFMTALGVLHFAWLPRIVRGRLAAELAADPDAWRRHRRDRRLRWLGFALGRLCGSAGVVAGILLSRTP